MDNTISSEVRDYYDSLFENVDFYFQTVREEVGEFQQEIDELKMQLAGAEPGVDKDAISTRLLATMGDLENRKEYLSGNTILAHGIEFSTDILDDNEPELTDQFLASPAEEKYAYLSAKFQDDYRSGLHERLEGSEKALREASSFLDVHSRNPPSGWDNIKTVGVADRQWREELNKLRDNRDAAERDFAGARRYVDTTALVGADAAQYAQVKIHEYFPKIEQEHQEAKIEQLHKQMAIDPVKAYEGLVDEYANDYCGFLRGQMELGEKILKNLQTDMERLDSQKPGMVQNLVTAGSALKEWNDRCVSLQTDMDSVKRMISKTDEQRYRVASGDISEARAWAEGTVASVHAKVFDAYKAATRSNWEQTNQKRLERQALCHAGRDDGAENSAQLGMNR